MLKDIFLRIVAVFILDALGTIGSASIFGIDTWTAAAIAGVLSVGIVFQDLARSFLKDGKLSKEEVNEAFGKAAVDE